MKPSLFVRTNTLLLLFLLLLNSCGHTTVWGHPPRQFTELVRKGTLPQFSTEDLTSLPLDELTRLGPGAAYFLSFHTFRDEAAPILLLEAEILRGEEPFAYEALLRLAEIYSVSRDYEAIVALDRSYGEVYRSRAPWRRIALEAYYWTREDQTAVERLREYRRRFPDSAREDGELKLIETVLAQRLALPEWRRSVLDLFRRLPAGPYHIRLYDYLRIEELLDQFSVSEGRFLRAIDLLARGEAQDAYRALEELFKEPEFIDTGSLASLASAAAGGGRLRDGIALLETLRSDEALSAEFRGEIDRQRAFLLRRAGRHAEAEILFNRLSLEAEDQQEAERFRWYAFSSMVRNSPREAVRRLPWLLMSMEEPSYYADVLNELVSRLGEAEEWERIAEAYAYLDGAVPGPMLRRVAYLSARAGEEELVSAPLDLSPQRILEKIAAGEYPGAGEYPEAEEFGPDYYRIVSALRLEEAPPRFYSVKAVDDGTYPGDILVEGYLRFGLVREAGRRAGGADVSPLIAEEAARAMAEVGLHDPALRLLLGRELPAEAEAFYPRPFREISEAAAEREELAPWLLYALMRQESLFNPEARSYVGALGLSQLMPATAADVARRLGLSDPDLTDPEDNLALGAWYLRHMIERSENLPDALAAYNAGITRVRRWRRARGYLPMDLYIETIPFDETRNYVKRLLVSSYHYGYLYYRLDSARLAELFFPDWR